MKKNIISFIEDLKSNKKLSSFDEASTKQAVVMKLLSVLSWDVFDVDEVTPDYSIKSQSIDFALKAEGKNKVFINVKKPNDNLNNNQKGLIGASSKAGVDIAVLTNGIEWWFYLPSIDGDVDDKRFDVLHINEQDPADIADKLKDLLEKSSVESGTAVTTAEAVFEGQQQMLANYTVPEAWVKILSGPNKILVKLLEDTTENLCGFKAEKGLITKFLKERAKEVDVPDAPPVQTKVTKKAGKAGSKAASKAAKKSPKMPNYSGKEPVSFSFSGLTYEVAGWDELLLTLCEIMVAGHKDEFDKVLWLSGKNRNFFSTDDNELRSPEKIKQTNIYVDMNLSPNDTVKLCHKIIQAFGYPVSELEIDAKDED